MPYQAWINIPGYLPQDDDDHGFDTIADAWQYLADERKRDEQDTECEFGTCGEAVEMLRKSTQCGSVRLHTPGYTGDHDLGLAYSVNWVADDKDRCDHEWVASDGSCIHCGAPPAAD